MLICNTVVNGREFKSMYFPKRLSESVVFLAKTRFVLILSFLRMSQSYYICLHFTAVVIKNVKITPERVKVLVGDTLVLNCTGETTYDGRLNFTWNFPRKRVSSIYF